MLSSKAAGARSSRLFALILGLVVSGSLWALSPAPATAAPYDVEICTPAARGENGIRLVTSQGATPFIFRCGNQFDGGIRLAAGAVAAQGGPHTGFVQWTLEAPANTTIRTLETNRVFFSLGNSGLRWSVTTGGGTLLEEVTANGQPPPPSGPVLYQVNSSSVTGRLLCPTALGCQGTLGTSTIITVQDVIAHMEDNSLPTLTGPLGGSLLAGGQVGGMRELSFNASDLGSGISEAILTVDGTEMATLSEPNAGKCVRPFKFVVPCALTLSASLPLDTTRIANGEHRAQVAVVDASGQRAASAPIPFMVNNGGGAPPGDTPPREPPKGDTTPPALTGVSLSRTRFRVAAASTARTSAWRAVARGTTLKFTSSEAGRLSLDIEQVRRGGKAKRLQTLTHTIKVGRGGVPLSGRIGRKPLTAGRYRITVTARDAAGNVSAAVRRSFTILPG